MANLLSPPQPPVFWTPILYDIAHALESVEDPEHRINRVFALMRGFVPYDRCALMEAVPVLGERPLVVPEVPIEERDALAARLSDLLGLISERPLEQMRAMPPRAAGLVHLAVPIIGLGETTGIVFVERASASYEESHLAFLSVVAAQVGAYLAAVKADRDLRTSETERADLLEKRESDLNFLEMFMGMLGHDLRNPLGAIRMSAEHLERTNGVGLSSTTARILSSTDRMERMVEQLLDLTRIRLAGGMPVEPTPVDLGDVCQRVVDELEAAHPDAVIRHEISGDVTGTWDRDLLLQLVSNLVANAIQHAQGSRDITLRVSGKDRTVELTTHNPGAIPCDLQPILFDPFRGTQTSGARKGLGLGLFITRHIVQAHGGSIGVASSEPEGTTFTVLLPRQSALHHEGPA